MQHCVCAACYILSLFDTPILSSWASSPPITPSSRMVYEMVFMDITLRLDHRFNPSVFADYTCNKIIGVYRLITNSLMNQIAGRSSSRLGYRLDTAVVVSSNLIRPITHHCTMDDSKSTSTMAQADSTTIRPSAVYSCILLLTMFWYCTPVSAVIIIVLFNGMDAPP